MWHLSWNAVVACRWSFPGMRLYERLLFKSQCTCALLHHSYILRDRCVGKSPERKKGRTDSKNKQTLAFLSSYFFKLLHLYVAVFSGKPVFFVSIIVAKQPLLRCFSLGYLWMKFEFPCDALLKLFLIRSARFNAALLLRHFIFSKKDPHWVLITANGKFSCNYHSSWWAKWPLSINITCKGSTEK